MNDEADRGPHSDGELDDEYEYEYEDEGGPARAVADSLRKAVVNGLSAVLMTEEGIRQAVSDLRLPKDAVGYLSQQAERSRREVSRIVGEEVKRFLHNTDMAGLLRKSLSGMKVEVRASLKFDEDLDVDAKVTSTRVGDDKKKR
ncbi:MAG: hypothetical protein AAFY60_05175 [Myxococcota bacterium]